MLVEGGGYSQDAQNKEAEGRERRSGSDHRPKRWRERPEKGIHACDVAGAGDCQPEQWRWPKILIRAVASRTKSLFTCHI